MAADLNNLQVIGTFQASSGFARLLGYESTDDALATIEASGYFNQSSTDVYADPILAPQTNDFILVNATDGSALLVVTDTDPTTTSALIGSTTALTENYIWQGNASNIETAYAVTGDLSAIAGAFTIANNAVTSAKLATNLIQYTSVNISLANFIAMYSTPIQLVAAPGANKQLVLNRVKIVQTYGSAALAVGGTVGVQYDSTVHGAGVLASTTLANTVLQATASSVYTLNSGVVVAPFTTTVNKGLYLSCDTADFTTGTGSSFVAHIWYSTIATA